MEGRETAQVETTSPQTEIKSPSPTPSDTRVYETQIRAHLGTTAHDAAATADELRTTVIGMFRDAGMEGRETAQVF